MEKEDVVIIVDEEDEEESSHPLLTNPVYYSNSSSEEEETSSYITDYDSDYWDHDEYVFVEYEERVSPEETKEEPEIYIYYHPDIVPKGWWYDPKYAPKNNPEEAIIHIPSYHDSEGFLGNIGKKFGKVGKGIKKTTGRVTSGIRKGTKKVTGSIGTKFGTLKKKIKNPFKGKGGTTMKKPMAKMGMGGGTTKPSKKKTPSASTKESTEERAARKREAAKQRKLEAQRIAAKERKLEKQRIAKEEARQQVKQREREKLEAKRRRAEIASEQRATKVATRKSKLTTALGTVMSPEALQLRTIAGQMGFDNTGTTHPMDVRFLLDFTKYTSGYEVNKASRLLDMAKNNGWTRNDILNRYNTILRAEGGTKVAMKKVMLKLATDFQKGPFDLSGISNM